MQIFRAIAKYHTFIEQFNDETYKKHPQKQFIIYSNCIYIGHLNFSCSICKRELKRREQNNHCQIKKIMDYSVCLEDNLNKLTFVIFDICK